MITLFIIRPKGFNIGNDAIYVGMKHFLSEAFGEIVNLVEFPASSRYESHVKAGLTAKTVHEINQYGHGVIVGGGNLYENGELQIDSEALQALEVPMMLFSLSTGRIFNRHHRLVRRTDAMPDHSVLLLNKKAAYSLARDHGTHDYLHRVGAGAAVLGGCPTIFLDRMASRLPELSRADSGGVLVSVRHPELMNIPLVAKARVREQVNGILDFLRSEEHRDVRLLCHDHRDIPFAASFTGVPYVYTGDIYVYLALLRSCALNVSFRLHSVLPCLAFGTPVIGISYDERGLSLFETIGYGNWNIDLVRGGDFLADFEDRYRRLGQLDTLKQQNKPLWKDLYATMAKAFRSFAADVTRGATTGAAAPLMRAA